MLNHSGINNMSFFSFLKAAPKLTDNVFDKDKGLLTQVGSWIGNSQHTEEEKAEMSRDIGKGVQAYAIATLQESTERSVTRRLIAVHIIKFYTLLVFMTGMTYPISEGWSQVWFNLATDGVIGGLVIAISIFFYGAHIIREQAASRGK
jgi:VIT1/CCC1 family predicted Fe2+/Mn2+ transporter